MIGPAPASAWFLIIRERTDGRPAIEVARELPRFAPIVGLRMIARISEASATWLSIDEVLEEIVDGTLPLWAHDAKV